MLSSSKTNIIILLLYLSLLIGLYFGEDSLGGAFRDYQSHGHISEKFRNDLLGTLLSYDELGHRHSPLFYIFKSFLVKNEIIMRLIFLHIYILIPLFFYKSLKILFESKHKNFLKLLSSVLLLFPTVRSYSIWPDPHLLGTVFFSISIFYFLKHKNEKKNSFRYCNLNIFFLAISAYFSPNFGIFVIYFLYEFIKLKKNFKEIFYILLINLILSLPFFYYLFILDINFIFNDSGWDIGSNIFSLNNISNKFIIINSLFLFYLMPFLLYSLNLNELYKNIIKKFPKLLPFFLLYIIFTLNFDFQNSYNLTNSGGGFVYNLSQLLFKNNYLLFFIGFLGFIILADSFLKNYSNLFLFLALIFSNPQITLWQANYSPLLFIVILLLFDQSVLKNLVSKNNIFVCFIYYFIYLISNIIYKMVYI